MADQPDQEFSPRSTSETNGGEEAKSQQVETWHPHPRHEPTPPYEMLRNPSVERRRPENAGIRRWMDLADKALKSDPTSETEEDPTPA